MTGTIITGILLFIIFVGVFYTRESEIRKWNNGICPMCGSDLILPPWMLDSQGGRGWTCPEDDCTYTAWVSYNIDRKVEL